MILSSDKQFTNTSDKRETSERNGQSEESGKKQKKEIIQGVGDKCGMHGIVNAFDVRYYMGDFP